ncbi:ACS family glucarate transporter-like MFS transporter [Novosphingobium chloroacetimidivorans]|uniref:ACS family glucarate transporter-like MFS transporter n=1 Tax=Novosphingobium chloroacetimidivorans TaxID=1428314 RepID=A0A7W7NUX5_9SPHN|nr:MFS transporter [Novosphingobium chloroacetimidivorans]MBB4857963.1 ACS family glucarate transporter-like MFS transporter [Novosphingobium chloroacetimidivorans]
MIRKDGFRSWGVIVLVGLALTIAHSDRVLLAIAAPHLIEQQHITGTGLGLLLSAFSWTYMVAQLPSGWLVDRFGPKRVLTIGFIGWSLVSAMTGLSTVFSVLLLCRMLLGVFEAPLYAVAHAVMASLFTDRRRALATAIYSKGVSLGPAIGTAAGSYVMMAYGWSEMFVIVGLGSLLFLIPWIAFAPSRQALAPSSQESRKIDWSEARKLLMNRSVLGVSVGYFGFLYLYYIYATWLPTYLSKERGLDTEQIAWMATVPFLISMAAGPVTGWFTDWLIGRGMSQTVVRKCAIGLGLLLGGAIVPAAFATDGYEAAVLFVIALVGQSISAANMLALPSAIAPEGRAGLVGSFQQMFGAAGGVVSPLLTGILYDQGHDFKAAILCAAAMLVLSGFCFLILLQRVERIASPDLAEPA